MTEFNIDRIKTLVGVINESLSKLEKINRISEEEFLEDSEKIDGAKYNLIVVMEGAIDICNHVAAKAGGRAPQSYTDCFEILETLEVYPGELAKKLKLMAKLRNLLVHRYWTVDNRRVYSIIREDIQVVRKYLQTVDLFIRQSENEK